MIIGQKNKQKHFKIMPEEYITYTYHIKIFHITNIAGIKQVKSMIG